MLFSIRNIILYMGQDDGYDSPPKNTILFHPLSSEKTFQIFCAIEKVYKKLIGFIKINGYLVSSSYPTLSPAIVNL